MFLTSAPRGTFDVLPEEVVWWHHLRAKAQEVAARYGYGEIVTPVFEHTELFVRTTGETSDIVGREMYTFKDRSDRSLTLRPEGTPGIGRAYLEHKIYSRPQPSKFFLFGPMFRYEKPQAGRQRQFNQFDVEIFGSESYLADAEVIALAIDYLAALGVSGLEVHLNSIGCVECRPAYRQALIAYFKEREEALCEDCKRRLDTNPLRLLDCKNESCRAIASGAPITLDYLCDACKAHFQGLQDVLKAEGVPYALQTSLVRGLDYYTWTVFEFIYPALGAQNAVFGGGRYDGLIESLGGDPTPGVGWAIGLERLIMMLQKRNVPVPENPEELVSVITSKESQVEGFGVARSLRQSGVRADIDLMGRSFKAQMKHADRQGSAFAVFIGGDEVAKGAATVRTMATGEQALVPFQELPAYIKSSSAVGSRIGVNS